MRLGAYAVERMESFLVDVSAEGVASSNGSGWSALNGIRHGMSSESDVFQEVVREVGLAVGGGGSHPVGEAEEATGVLGGTGAARILDSRAAAAGGDQIDSGKAVARQSAALALVPLVGKEAPGEGPWTLAAAATGAASEAPTTTDTTTEQPADDSRDLALDGAVIGLAPRGLEFTPPLGATGHDVHRRTVGGEDGATVVDAAAAQPWNAIRNRGDDSLAPPGLREEAGARIFRPVARGFAEAMDRADLPETDLRVQAVERFESVRVPSDLDRPAQPGHILEENGSKMQGATGQNHQADAVRFAPDPVAATEAVDSGGRQGDRGTSHESPANDREGRERAGMPEREAVVRSYQTGQEMSIEPLAPRTPSTSSLGATPSDHGREPALMRADTVPRQADGFGTSRGTQTVHAVQVNLDQEELGRLRVRVVLADSTVHTRVTTEYADLGQFLMDRREQLESALHASGLDVGQFKVHIDRQGSGQSADDWMTRSFGDESHQPRGRHEPMRPDADAPSVAEAHGLSVFA